MTRPAHTVKRICSGMYEVHKGSKVVTIRHNDCWKGWVASANWDPCCYTDPIPTKRDAVFNAKIMLDEPRQ